MSRLWRVLGLVGLIGGWCSLVSAQGLIAPGAGPINRAMAGASTAAPVDFGSTYWNPANLAGLQRQEFLIGSELIIPSTHLTTGVRQGAFGNGLPTSNRYGVSRSDSGVVPNLAVGGAIRLDPNSPWTYGLGIFGYVGGNVNFQGNPSIPLLSPQRPPNTFGFGPIWGNASMITINPSAALRLSENLSVAGGPVISNMSLGMSPAFFAPGPRDINGLRTFPAATNSRPFWGGGFQLGLLYELENWNIGFSYKSPIWQERWGYNSSTPDGSPRRIGLDAGIPAIYSWGIAYKGVENLLVDLDLRYMDYANVGLFGQRVVDGGLGWRSVFAVALGGQYQATDRLTLRAGYLYNTNPIPTTATLFNIQLPGIVTNTLSLGGSFKLTEDVTLSTAWVHGFRNDITGDAIQEPAASVKIDSQIDSIIAGVTVQFGAKRQQPTIETATPLPTPEVVAP